MSAYHTKLSSHRPVRPDISTKDIRHTSTQIIHGYRPLLGLLKRRAISLIFSSCTVGV